MNLRLGFLEHDRRRCIDTRLCEMVAGWFAMIYGWKATQPGYSEFQAILSLREYAFEWGVTLFAVGLLMNAFAFSRFPWIRAALAFLLLGCWGGVVVMFLNFRNAGIPLWCGLAWSAAALVFITTVILHEKHVRSGPVCLD